MSASKYGTWQQAAHNSPAVDADSLREMSDEFLKPRVPQDPVWIVSPRTWDEWLEFKAKAEAEGKTAVFVPIPMGER